MHASRATLNYPEVPLYQPLEEAVRRWPENVAIIDQEVQLTYAQLDDQINRFATALAVLGVEAGQQICLLLPNSIEFVVSFFGVLKVGAVPSAMNPAYKAREIAYQYQESEAVMLITREDFYPTIKALGTQVDLRVIVSASNPIEGTYHFQTLIDTHEATPPRPTVNAKDDIAAMPFTSGTTGSPKGVMLTHHNLGSNWRQFSHACKINQDDIVLLFLPLYHIYGAMIMGGGLMQGATLVLQERFDPQGTLALIQTHRPTQLYVVPPVLVLYNQLPEVHNVDWSSLRFVMSGAAPLSKEVGMRFQELTGVTVFQGYGTTEASPVTHCNPLDRDKVKLHTVGPPVANTEQKVVDLETGKDLPLGQTGELLVRGPQVMKGYWKRPEENAKVLAGGWLHTGDVAHIDEQGFVTIVDRSKSMIKYKGFAIGPAELEDVLFEHEAVADCAVIGILNAQGEEVPKAFVVKQGEVSERELMAFVKDRVAGYKQIRVLEFIDSIPKNPSGKILKRILIEREHTAS